MIKAIFKMYGVERKGTLLGMCRQDNRYGTEVAVLIDGNNYITWVPEKGNNEFYDFKLYDDDKESW